MAVEKSKQTTTTVAFAAEAKRLAVDVTGYAETLPGRNQNHLAIPLSRAATEMLRHVFCAKRIYVVDGPSLGARRAHLNEALGNLDMVETLMEMVYDTLQKSYESQRRQDEIELDRKVAEGMEEWYEGAFLPTNDDLRGHGEGKSRKRKSKRPNPNFFKLYADRIKDVRSLLVGVKKADSDKHQKRKARKGPV